MSSQHIDARKIVAKGLEIYDRKYRAKFEEQHDGTFAAIDIDSEAVYLADLPENALSKARAASPKGLFFLLRIGSPGAFKRRSLTCAPSIAAGRSM
jgi:hypothetical protein